MFTLYIVDKNFPQRSAVCAKSCYALIY